jgi:hypothetical protein
MAKKKTHVVKAPKRDQNKIVIAISPEERMRLNRANNRQDAIEQGQLTRSGAGAHGGGYRAETRRNRRKSKEALRHGQSD